MSDVKLTKHTPVPFTLEGVSLDERLKDAAIQGDVAFLKEVVASKKPMEYFKLKYYPRYPDQEHRGNNIFHFAVMNRRVDFCTEALEILPFLDVHDLLKDKNDDSKTPLHEDLLPQDDEISGMIEDFYRRCNIDISQLKNAVIQGDVEFLRKAVDGTNKPIKSVYVPCPIRKDLGGNMLHLAAYHEKVEFLKAALEILPVSDLDILLWQPHDPLPFLDGDSVLEIVRAKDNRGEIVKLIEGIYEKRNSMDEQLKKAATEGDIQFLKQASKPTEHLQSLYYVTDPSTGEQTGNILHLAARHNRVAFMREAMEMLSKSGINVHSLLCQEDHPKFKRSPLHVAAERGYTKVVMAILDYYANSMLSNHPGDSCSSSLSSPPSWSLRDRLGRTPFHVILAYCREECTLKLLSVDTELFSLMGDCLANIPFSAPLIRALERGFNKVVLKFFESTRTHWNTFDKRVLALALGVASSCSDEIFKLVLEKNLQFIQDKDFCYIWSPLKEWATAGKLYPFKYVFDESRDTSSLKRCLIDTMYQQNPLYCVAEDISDEDKSIGITKILVSAYKKEKEEQSSVDPPWFMRDRYWGHTPLYRAIKARREKVALHFLGFENVQVLLGDGEEYLFLAVRHECREVAQKILDLVDEHCLRQLLIRCDDERTILHDVPMCKGANNFLKQLVKRHPDLIEKCDENGETILHRWMKIGELWAFECILNTDDFSSEVRSKFAKLLKKRDDDKGRNPLHVAAEVGANGVIEHIVRTLFDAIRDQKLYEYYHWNVTEEDNQGKTPIEIALSTTGLEELAFCLLSALPSYRLRNKETAKYLFTAIAKKLHKVVKFILEVAHKDRWQEKYLRSEGRNVLHVASNCTEESGKLIIEGWPTFITKPDPTGKTPLEIASKEGASWLVKLILQKEQSSIVNAPKAWIEACERGHLSTLLTFVDDSSYFKFICGKCKDTPLHHIKLDSYKKYQELFQCELMKEFKNTVDFNGDTPLQKAIESRNKELTGVLLTMEDVNRNAKNKKKETAMDLLEKASNEDEEWKKLCETLGIEPGKKLTYIPYQKDLAHMRETISLVAALLATITFTAGFTVPGGFNSNTGEAILIKKAAFVVFLIADTYAMCCSMLILFAVIWSLICDRNTASLLADRSLELLKQSLYGTLVAFMTGVYVTIHNKSLWTAIVVIVMCSLVIILAQRNVLYFTFDKLNVLTNKCHRVQHQLSFRWEKQTCIKSHANAENLQADEHHTSEATATTATNSIADEQQRIELASCWQILTSYVTSLFRGGQSNASSEGTIQNLPTEGGNETAQSNAV